MSRNREVVVSEEPFITQSEAVTRGVRVRVRARYAAEHSEPQKPLWFFLYTITISNEGNETVRLLNRHWVITDAHGETEQVRGPGVVGEQPLLEPGQSFEYTSGCPLSTEFGSMHGSYDMVVVATGEHFDAEVAGFALRKSPAQVN
ncbi:MAG: Co2+/Mg2+ efflux protein ApaG [Myxococcales bacterium]|jgi:ApaG protein|nr:Co2+/Mg2+ efflux protein ApaG [Myxococcales bacterium]